MPCIEIEHLSHVYFPGTPLETTALQNISLVVQRGEYLALAGTTGSGKSTLVRHFNGLLTPTAGRIWVLGGDVADRKYRRELWRRVGLIFQFPERQIFSATVYEDIAFGPYNMGLSGAALEERVQWAAEAVDLPEEGLSADPNQLSGGMRRRAAIAGVLAMRPEILILDEPGVGLEPRARERILQLVKELQIAQNMTVILITHQLEDAARYADRVALLHQGRLVAAGGTGDILSREELLQDVGLEPPFAVSLAGGLSRVGVSLPETPLTLDDAVKLLAPQLKNSTANREVPHVKRKGDIPSAEWGHTSWRNVTNCKERGHTSCGGMSPTYECPRRRNVPHCGITMGQYLPGHSPVHKMDPRAKLISAVLVVSAVLLSNNWAVVLAVTFWVALVTGLSGVRPGVYWRSLKPLWLLLLLSFLLQILLTPGESLVYIKRITISEAGLAQGGWLLWRLGMLFLLATIITFTTTPLRLTNALEWLLTPLAWIKVPVREMAMIMNLALRFVPTLFDEARLLLMAQQSRGADFTRGNAVQRVRGLVPFMVPLLANIFHRADELALAMELRCYRVGAARSRIAELRFGLADYVVIATAFFLLALVLFIGGHT